VKWALIVLTGGKVRMGLDATTMSPCAIYFQDLQTGLPSTALVAQLRCRRLRSRILVDVRRHENPVRNHVVVYSASSEPVTVQTLDLCTRRSIAIRQRWGYEDTVRQLTGDEEEKKIDQNKRHVRVLRRGLGIEISAVSWLIRSKRDGSAVSKLRSDTAGDVATGL